MREIIPPLTHGDIEATKETYKLWAHQQQLVTNRINYIVRQLAEIFGGKIEWWDFTNGSSEGEVDGHFTADMLKENTINLDGSKKGKDWISTIKEGEWDFPFCFPTRFLWDNFESEVLNGIYVYRSKEKAKEEADKKREEIKKLNKQALINSAISKLTQEERKAIGV